MCTHCALETVRIYSVVHFFSLRSTAQMGNVKVEFRFWLNRVLDLTRYTSLRI